MGSNLRKQGLKMTTFCMCTWENCHLIRHSDTLVHYDIAKTEWLNMIGFQYSTLANKKKLFNRLFGNRALNFNRFNGPER